MLTIFNPTNPLPRLAILAILAAAVGLAGALLPGLSTTPALHPPPVAASPGHIGVQGGSAGLSITSTPASGDSYATGETITVRVRFTNCITQGSGESLTIAFGSGTVTASRTSSYPSQNVTFSHTVTDSNYDPDGFTIATNAIAGTYHSSQQSGCSGVLPHAHTGFTLPNVLATAQASHKVNDHFINYASAGNARLIDIDSLAKLNAIRYDLDGDGSQDSAVSDADWAAHYLAAFPDPVPGMGCTTSCQGYELTADLDFDAPGAPDYTSGAGWVPIGADGTNTKFAAIFDGNGHTISNLTINSSNVQDVGLFGWYESDEIRNVGLLDVDIRAAFSDATQQSVRVGALAGVYNTTVRYSYATGSVRVSVSNNTTRVFTGGLLGAANINAAVISTSWSAVNVAVDSAATINTNDNVGGLAGYTHTSNDVTACYATGTVTGGRPDSNVGGLLGSNSGDITASYAIGRISVAGGATSVTQLGGLVGSTGSGTTITNSYWDTETTDRPALIITTRGEGHPTADLQMPTEYGSTGIYATWNVDADADAATGDASGNDDPWHFGGPDQYPILKFGHNPASIAHQRGVANVDYDRNNNSRIEVATLEQLNAIRYDLNGSGHDGLTGSDRINYALAYPGAIANMGCPGPGTCAGYELAADLDFDYTGDDTADGVYAEWVPIGTRATSARYSGTFYGNGHTISNLRIRTTDAQGVGLFGYTSGGALEDVGLLDVDIDVSYTASTATPFSVGGLVGGAETRIRNSYVTGKISTNAIRGTANGPFNLLGGLVGVAGRATGSRGVFNSWADVDITVASNSTSSNSDMVGGLIGQAAGLTNRVDVIGNYAHGDITINLSGSRTNAYAGGLIGWMAAGTLSANYSTGTPTCAACNSGNVNGLMGRSTNNPTLQSSYWDVSAANIADDSDNNAPEGETTINLIETDSYTGIFEDWNVNVDGQPGNDDPWDFGGALQYPILQHGYSRAAIALQRSRSTRVDYDTDGDNLIEIRTLPQLAAFRLDAKDGGTDGDGVVIAADQADYDAAFPLALPNMGCPRAAGCLGYELMAHLDFDTDGDGSTHTAGTADDGDAYADDGGAGAGWASPNQWNATFEGNGYTIANLYINFSSTSGGGDWIGMFSGLGNGGVVRSVGLLDPYVNATSGATQLFAGALVGNNVGGRVIASYVIGGTVSGANGDAIIGGLIGRNTGTNSSITACYALGNTVTSSSSAAKVGGLVGGNYTNASVIASWAASSAVSTGSGGNALAGGLVAISQATVTDGVSDNVNGRNAVADGSGGASYDTADLQGATGYTAGGPFANFNVNLDGVAGNDDPWDFTTASNQYPILKYGFTAPGARAAQLDPQDATLRAIVAPDDVDRVRKTGTYAYTLEVDPPVQSVTLDDASFTETQAGASSAVTAVMPDPPSGTTPWAVGDTEIPLAAGETPTVATVTVTSASGLSTLDYAVTIQRIFCPKAQLSGPADVVGEGGVAEFTVLVCGETTAPVVVGWRAEGAAVGGASAASGADLSGRGLPSTGTVTVPAGSEQTAVISFPIADDETAEGSESFTVTLTSASGGTERYEDDESASATIALSDPALELAAPDGTGTGGAADRSNAPLTPQSRLVLTEGDTHAYTIALSGNPGETVTVVIHSNHASITTTPPTVTFNAGNYQTPQRVTINAAQDGDDRHERATLTHILTDADGGVLEIIDRLALFVTDVDPPDDDDDVCR